MPAATRETDHDGQSLLGRHAQVYEAGLQQRTVVIEFDSVEQARAALAGGAERDIRILEAV